MKEQLTTSKTAKLAKEKGFNIWCYFGYNEIETLLGARTFENSFKTLDHKIKAPTQSLLQKWLRDTHNINIIVVPYNGREGWVFNHRGLIGMHNLHEVLQLGKFKTYEEALEKGLQEALKLIKK